jgi:hypothetical protein
MTPIPSVHSDAQEDTDDEERRRGRVQYPIIFSSPSEWLTHTINYSMVILYGPKWLHPFSYPHLVRPLDHTCPMPQQKSNNGQIVYVVMLMQNQQKLTGSMYSALLYMEVLLMHPFLITGLNGYQ